MRTLNKASQSDLRKLSSFLQKDAKKQPFTPAYAGGVDLSRSQKLGDVETLEKKVARFEKHYLELIKIAEIEQNRAHQKVHSKILACSILDAISKSVFPETNSNRKRFINLVRLCGKWPESQKVSLLHLVRLFEVTPNLSSKAQELKEFAIQKFDKAFPLSNRMMSNNIPISLDAEIGDILNLWPNESGKYVKIGNVLPHQLKHEHLLWLYRNSLVHEYRNPGRGVELGKYVPEYAFYQEVSTVSSMDKGDLKFTNQWELVYPYSFFIDLCRDALEMASLQHSEKKTSPFNAYSEGTYWLPDFNE